MSFDPTHKIWCACWRCHQVYQNSQKQIWLHHGIGSFERNAFDNLPVSCSLDPNIAFTEPEFKSYCDNQKNMYNYSLMNDKPFQCIWFSSGSWLFDCYCAGNHDHDHNKNSDDSDDSNYTNYRTIFQKGPNIYKVMMTKKPQNILQITTFEDLEEFRNKFSVTKFRNLKHYMCNEIKLLINNFKIIMIIDFIFKFFCLLKLCLHILFDKHKYSDKYEHGTAIMWPDIYKAGYYGVSFNFRKVDHLPSQKSIDKCLSQYLWHYSFDVESLCIFDLRAFQNLTIENVKF